MPSQSSVKIFYVYSHAHEEDMTLKDRLDKHLRPLYQLDIVHWDDREITPGQEWDGEIKKHLNGADIILLLISSDFMASEYCYKQMKIALDRHNKGEARVIPIILRHVDWGKAPFSHLQVLPEGGRPINSWADKDEACTDVSRGVRRAIGEVQRGWEEQRLRREAKAHKLREEADEYFSQRHYKEALRCYDEALLLLKGVWFNKDKVEILQREADILHQLNHIEEALYVYEEAIRLESGNGRLHEKKGDILYHQKHFEEAFKAYGRAVQALSSDPLLHKKKGDALLKLEHWEDAIEAYNKSIASIDLISEASSIAQIYASKGKALLELRRFKEALSAYDTAIKREPENAESWRYKGEIYSELGSLEEAKEAYDRAIALKGDDPYFYNEYGEVFFKLKCFDEAQQQYDKAIDLEPGFSLAYGGRSRVFKAMAQKKEEEHKNLMRLARLAQEESKRLIKLAQKDEAQFRRLEARSGQPGQRSS